MDNSKELSSLLSLEGKRFDIKVPKIYGGKLIPDGKRYATAQMYMLKLIPMYFRCLSYGLDYSYEDLEFTFKRLIDTNFEDGAAWLKGKWNVLGKSLRDLYDNNCKKDYNEIEKDFTCSTKKDFYRTKNYCMAMTICYCNEYAANGKVTFESKEDFKQKLPNVSEETFKKYMPEYLEFEILNRKERSDKGSKRESIHDWILYTVDNGILYHKKGELDKAESRFCERNGISYKVGKIPGYQSLMKFSYNKIENGTCHLNFPEELNLSKKEKCDIYFDLLLEQECRTQEDEQFAPHLSP